MIYEKNEFMKEQGQPRTYRSYHNTQRFRFFNAQVFESDLHIGVDTDSYDEEMPLFCEKEVKRIRTALHVFNSLNPGFFNSLEPVPDDSTADPIIRTMINAGVRAEVGPMASVAGITSELVGMSLKKRFDVKEVIVENGGDVWVDVKKTVSIEILAGDSPLSGKLALRIDPQNTPVGICASSGTVGHSFSFGKADAVVVAAHDSALADAFATKIGNMVSSQDDIEKALKYSNEVGDLLSTVIIVKDKVAISGKFEIAPVKHVTSYQDL